ncbi:hypothetical protein [Methanococcus voltae]|uniref:Uncharacterized protein n=1 Tax=Methanococcus voltae (strain ATCC BAA-1334 / A3) TaxID=456320 RepID=D7DTQ5_METV3|nr:hypothetical protein [Methanococcus voltae]MCS3901369.1 hypothetical protein [Methanococcus voltae]
MIFENIFSKNRKFRTLLEDGLIAEALKQVQLDESLQEELYAMLKSKVSKLRANSIHVLTKLAIKDKSFNQKALINPIRRLLADPERHVVLTTLVCVKIFLKSYSEAYPEFESSIVALHNGTIDLEIREYTNEIIKTYGTFKGKKVEHGHEVLREKFKKIIDNESQSTLVVKLKEISEYIQDINPETSNIEISKDKLNRIIEKEKISSQKVDLNSLHTDFEELDPMDLVCKISSIQNSGRDNISSNFDRLLELSCSRSTIIRNSALNAIYEITKKYPDITYSRVSFLEKYLLQYGSNSVIFKHTIQELANNYDLSNYALSRLVRKSKLKENSKNEKISLK